MEEEAAIEGKEALFLLSIFSLGPIISRSIRSMKTPRNGVSSSGFGERSPGFMGKSGDANSLRAHPPKRRKCLFPLLFFLMPCCHENPPLSSPLLPRQGTEGLCIREAAIFKGFIESHCVYLFSEPESRFSQREIHEACLPHLLIHKKGEEGLRRDSGTRAGIKGENNNSSKWFPWNNTGGDQQSFATSRFLHIIAPWA